MARCIGMGVAQAAMGDNAAALNSFELAVAIEPKGPSVVNVGTSDSRRRSSKGSNRSRR